MVNDLAYSGIKFPDSSRKDNSRIENIYISINVFCYENDLVCPFHVSDKKVEKFMDLLLTTNENKLHYVYIKYFNRFMCNKTKNKNKKPFCLQCRHCL